ncbi:hypothetical protein [Ferviditalea candida]|uniref:Uncharacterized protein n=1 Tax=Ferviditalea candida TaxID=3108399 RepID=A0ABU5ZK59_9BACL|nr:hypothetical protein [Paenibacillaceae bacterium T2]
MNVSIQVNGEFATTVMELSCRLDVETGKLVQEVREIDHVLAAELK